mgnify:CR=1 FL=1
MEPSLAKESGSGESGFLPLSESEYGVVRYKRELERTYVYVWSGCTAREIRS